MVEGFRSVYAIRTHLMYGSWIYSLVPMQSVANTTNVVSSNPTPMRCTRNNIM
jgi:hypothetical protein